MAEEAMRKRTVRPVNRRKQRGRVLIRVTEPGVIVIDQGKHLDMIDAPPGSIIERPRAEVLTSPDKTA